MNTNRQTFWNDTTASATCLGSVGRVHGNHLDTSFFRFVFQHVSEQSKPRIMRGQGQASVVVHEAKRKVFDSNQVVFIHQPTTNLVQVVVSLVGYLFVQSGNLLIRFLLPTTPFDLAGCVTLQSPQFSKTFSQPAGLAISSPVERAARLFKPTSTPT